MDPGLIREERDALRGGRHAAHGVGTRAKDLDAWLRSMDLLAEIVGT